MQWLANKIYAILVTQKLRAEAILCKRLPLPIKERMDHMKITFMGAGSTVFAKNVLGDCMCTPSLCDAEIALYDIDADRLSESEMMLSNINQNINQGKAKINSYSVSKTAKKHWNTLIL